MQNLLLLVLVFPLFSFLTIVGFGRHLGVYGSMLLSVVNILSALVVSVLLFFFVSFSAAVYVEL